MCSSDLHHGVPPVNFYGVGGYSVVAGDVNGDGRLDLALPGTVLLGNGDGTFQPAVSLGVSGDHVAVGDFNGDGKPDLASIRNVYSSIGYVSVLLNTCASAGTHLAITRSDATTTLSWPLPYANFVLESATNLGSTNWKGVPIEITTNNGRCDITMPFDLGQRFFRLGKP